MPDRFVGIMARRRPASGRAVARRGLAVSAFAALTWSLAAAALATTVIPISDRELYRRADVVVYGVVLSSETVEGPQGRPETVTTIEPVRVLKGRIAGDLVLHQAGGILPDGRFFKLWGRPEYTPGHEVVVFAIERPEGDYQTAEMLLGKFEVERDEAGRLFAVPDLAIGPHPGVAVLRPPATESNDRGDELPFARFRPGREGAPVSPGWNGSPRELARFLDFLGAGAAVPLGVSEPPSGALAPVTHSGSRIGLSPQWGNINNTLWRWSNGPTAGWQLVGTANMTGGGVSEATNALAAWTNDPNSTISYTVNPGAFNQIQLNATTSPCGWNTCVTSAGGVVGCGGPSGGGSNSWRGDNYFTITSGNVWLRCYATANAFGSACTQSFLMHELGHTLGLGHSDQNVSPHDVCRGDEASAIMYSSSSCRTALGTDDQDAIRWLYGDGGNSCTSTAPPAVTGVTPGFGPTAGNTLVTIAGANFQAGATVAFGGLAATGVVFVGPATLTARTPAHAAGSVAIVVTNPDTQSGTLGNGFLYQNGTGFYTLAPCRVVDTRNPAGPLGGPALAGGGARRVFVITGACGIPSSATAVVTNVTVTQPAAGGSLIVFPGNTVPAGTSTISFPAGGTRADNAILYLATDGSGSIVVENDSTGIVEFILDVNGYFQ